jgi:hypothetical protein
MYCYLYIEIKEQLSEPSRPEINALAANFRQHHLGIQDSIFDESTYEKVLNTLKELLDIIDSTTAVKDDDYWQYYEAIELFLYGDWLESDDGEIWGVSNFHSIWESICLTHLVKTNTPQSLIYIDTQYIQKRVLTSSGFSDEVINQKGQIFEINRSKLIPDAVLSVSIDRQLAVYNLKRPYKVYSDSKWNDYGYRTVMDSSDTKVAYVGQKLGEHTFEKLKNYYSFDELYRLVIHKPLEKEFYSFWEIDLDDTFDFECLHKMYYFNHLFYIALREDIFDWNSFEEKILNTLSIKFDLRHNSFGGNVFTHSLLRYYCVEGRVEGRKEEFQHQFDSTMKRIEGICNQYFELIDIKYLTESYFRNNENLEEIKSRSIRKQFVYEHLLQKWLENEGQSKRAIKSSFWLPNFFAHGDTLSETTSDFIGGYIQLKNIDFMTLANSYISS